MDYSKQGTQRATRLKTRLQTKLQKEEEQRREAAKEGMSGEEYWKTYVRSANDIVRFYAIYHPEVPEFLAKSIALRVSSIIEKSQRGEELTEAEKQYVIRSREPAKTWDPRDDIKEQEMAGKISLTMKKLEDLVNE